MASQTEYKQSEVGPIPKDWGVANLSELVNDGPKNGYSGPTGPDLAGTPTLSLAATSSGQLVLTSQTTKRLKETIPPESELFLRPSDVLVQRSNTADLVGTTAVFTGPSNTYVYPDLMMRLRFKSQVTGKWFWRYANSSRGRRFFRGVAAGSTGSMPKVSGQSLRAMPVPVPPLGEQEIILQALDDTGAFIEALEQLIAKKRLIKQGAMQELLTGRKRLPGFEQKWTLERLGDLAEMASGGTPPSSVSAYHDGDIPWVSINDMTQSGKALHITSRNISKLGLDNSTARVFPEGTVLYAMYASLGECSIAGIAMSSSQAILGIRPRQRLNSEFLYYSLVSIRSRVRGMGQHGTQANLNKRMVQDFELKLPPLAEQEAISSVLSDMDAEIEALEARVAKTRQIKQGMMQELLTGRIRLI